MKTNKLGGGLFGNGGRGYGADGYRPDNNRLFRFVVTFVTRHIGDSISHVLTGNNAAKYGVIPI